MLSVFQFGYAHLWENRKIYSWIKICSSKKVKKAFKILINYLFFFSINLLNLKTNHFLFFFFFFWSIINMWFLITGSYTSEKVNHSNRIDCSKYLNKNQALLRHKVQLSYTWFIFWAFRQTGKTGKKIPQTTWDTQKIFISLQLHIQYLIRSSG